MSTTEQTRLFLAEVAREVERARSLHPQIHSAHEGYAVILEELDEFKAEVWKKQARRNPAAMLTELIQCAAMCARVAVDIGLLDQERDSDD